MSSDLWEAFGPRENVDSTLGASEYRASGEPEGIDDWGEFEYVNDTQGSLELNRPAQNLSELPRPCEDSSVLLFDADEDFTNVEAGQETLARHDGIQSNSLGTNLQLGKVQSATDAQAGEDDEEWAEFEGMDQSTSSEDSRLDVLILETVNSSFPGQPQASKFQSVEDNQLVNMSSQTTLPPPSNVPPPSILLSLASNTLLSLLPKLRSLANSMHSTPSSASDSEPNRQISDGLSILRAIARLIAGRKHRWKRDTLLAQSVKIGPSHGGKAGGMKLAGVDKTEGRREDQEAAEVVRVWRPQAGTLRSAIAKLSQAIVDGVQLSVPEISETLMARPVKGMLSAPRACVICGLKRDERIEKVDTGLDDSFGEYWVQYWGHVDCKRFWDTYHGKLQRR